jgi:hypothetical protein
VPAFAVPVPAFAVPVAPAFAVPVGPVVGLPVVPVAGVAAAAEPLADPAVVPALGCATAVAVNSTKGPTTALKIARMAVLVRWSSPAQFPVECCGCNIAN